LKTLIIAFGLILLLTSCSVSWTSQDDIEPGQYMIRVDGNAFSKPSELKEKIVERATKLCGENNYTIGKGEAGMKDDYTFPNGGIMVIKKGYAKAIVTCKELEK